MPAERPRYATKARTVRLIAAARAAGFDIDKRTIEFAPDGTVRLVPASPPAPPAAGDDTWGDL